MRKPKSTETKNMKQTALWLPYEMHEKLSKAGGKGGMGVEIRRLLHAALEETKTPDDQVTAELLDQIKEIAELSMPAPWYGDRFSFDVFKSAINVLLSKRQPSRPASPETKANFQATWEEEDPEVIGRQIARLAVVAHAKERFGKAFLDKLKEQKG
jgi:hypothetical protein